MQWTGLHPQLSTISGGLGRAVAKPYCDTSLQHIDYGVSLDIISLFYVLYWQKSLETCHISFVFCEGRGTGLLSWPQ